MRAFIAIELPEKVKGILKDIQEKLKTAQADVRWVKPENIHLTLKFLGEIDSRKSQKIIPVLEDMAKNNSEFLAGLFCLGAFPKLNFPRVIWVSIEKGKAEIESLTRNLEKELAKIGIAKEKRPFSSHITLGRVRSGINRENLIKEINVLLESGNLPKPEFLVTKITFFESTLTPSGPIYKPLKEINLKTT